MNGNVFTNVGFREDLIKYLDIQRAPTSDEEFKNSSCDVYLRHAIESGESIYLAHSTILTYHSKRLREDFKVKKYNTATDGRRIVDISKDIDEHVLHMLIDYMYQGHIKLPEDNAPAKANLIFAMGYFQIESLGNNIFDTSNGVVGDNPANWDKNSIDITKFIIESSVRSEKESVLTMSNAGDSTSQNGVPNEDNALKLKGFKDWSSLARPPRTENVSGDSAISSISLGQGKTAVSALQEMMQKRSAPVPVYKEKGGVGPPFTIVCHVDQLITEGTGNSKKEAKHKAATSMLMKLHQDVNRAPGAPSLIKTRETPRQQSHDLSVMQPDEISNPVGLLQELMQKNGLAIPEYVPGDETCPPFSWQVKLPHTGQTCTGIGNKKAEAKGMAARRMLAQIKEHGLPQNIPTSDAMSLRRHPVSELQEYLQKRQISGGDGITSE